jgi:serine phosphatase RsbU (regulator of sigma subunit)
LASRRDRRLRSRDDARPGESVVFYTDGVTEERREEQFGRID